MISMSRINDRNTDNKEENKPNGILCQIGSFILIFLQLQNHLRMHIR